MKIPTKTDHQIVFACALRNEAEALAVIKARVNSGGYLSKRCTGIKNVMWEQLVRGRIAEREYDETGQILLKRGKKWWRFYDNPKCYAVTRQCIDNLELEETLGKEIESLLFRKPHTAEILPFPCERSF